MKSRQAKQFLREYRRLHDEYALQHIEIKRFVGLSQFELLEIESLNQTRKLNGLSMCNAKQLKTMKHNII